MKKIVSIVSATIGVFLLLLAGVFVSNKQPSKTLGSVPDISNGYYSTSTDSGWSSITNGSQWRLIKTGAGQLGSVVITASTAGTLKLYDATTTVNSGLIPLSLYSTSTIANFGASVAAGTYTFDVTFTRGLVAEFQSNAASGTITYK